MKNLITIATLIYCTLLGYNTHTQITSLNWKFKTNGRVMATPVISNGTVYIGSEDKNFYAINATDGVLKWKYQTSRTIKGEALVTGNIVFFEAGNIFYALSKLNGQELWHFDTGESLYHDQIDIYDDQRSKATAENNIIYVGTSSGFVYGLEKDSGKVKLKISTIDNSPVRSSPMIYDGRVYFGDWNGIVYCYSIDEAKQLWAKNTYSFQKPYETFGGIVSEFTIFKDKLFFGARNHVMNVLNLNTGEREWSYTSPEGGWMFGAPVRYDSMIYIGGSDNLSMHAFTPIMGVLKWKFNSGQNIMTKPLVTKEYIIFTTGNLYKPDAHGNIYRLKRETGELVTKTLIPQATVSSPVKFGNAIIFGCLDGFIYSVNLSEL